MELSQRPMDIIHTGGSIAREKMVYQRITWWASVFRIHPRQNSVAYSRF